MAVNLFTHSWLIYILMRQKRNHHWRRFTSHSNQLHKNYVSWRRNNTDHQPCEWNYVYQLYHLFVFCVFSILKVCYRRLVTSWPPPPLSQLHSRAAPSARDGAHVPGTSEPQRRSDVMLVTNQLAAVDMQNVGHTQTQTYTINNYTKYLRLINQHENND